MRNAMFTIQGKFLARRIGIAALVVMAGLGVVYDLSAVEKEAHPKDGLIVGTKEAPPFAMKDAEDRWRGISVDL